MMIETYKVLSFALACCLMLFADNSLAGLYKGLDEDGNVAYSDKPFTSAEKITPPAITVVDAPKITPAKEVIKEDKPEQTRYSTLRIITPKHNETIWNESQLVVSLQLKPKLNLEQGHSTWLFMDGKALVKRSPSLKLLIGRSDRGTHTLQAQVRNKKGKILKRSKSIKVHIKNSVVPRATPK